MAQYNTHNSIQWNQLINAINNSGGGGGGTSTTFTALDDVIRNQLNTAFTLNDSISNYDIIIIEMYATSQTYVNQYVGNSILIASDLVDNSVIWITGGQIDRYIQVQILNDNTYQILRASTGSMVKGIYGIKF